MKFSLDDLYRTLKEWDNINRKRYDDDSISDFDYFLTALNEDIVSNCISIAINILVGNKGSIGLDSNCRAIIEAFSLMGMLKDNKIDEKRLKLFRKQYFLVEYDNYAKKYLNDDMFKTLRDERTKVVDLFSDELGWDKDLIKKKGDEPLFFLRNNPNFGFKIFNQIEQYLPNNLVQIYDFFGIMIHPHFNGIDIDSHIKTLRNKYVDYVLDYVVEYFKAGKMIILDPIEESLEVELYQNKNYSINYLASQGWMNVYRSFIKKVLDVDKDIFEFNRYFFIEFGNLYFDMRLCMLLGFREQAIVKFKTAIELISIYYYLNDADDFAYLRKGFKVSSNCQLVDYFRRFDFEGMPSEYPDDELRDIYEIYYKNKYNVDFDTYKKNMMNNSYYFLSAGEKSYNSKVTDYINKCGVGWENGEKVRDSIKTVYRVSKDMEHGCGYLFNSSEGAWKFDILWGMDFLNIFVHDLMINFKIALKERNIDVDLDKEISLTKELNDDYRRCIFTNIPKPEV